MRTRGTPGVVRDPSMFLAPLAVAVVTAIAYANISADVLIHDDRFFYPSPSPLDGSAIAGFFRRDVWGPATGVPGLYRPLLLLSLAIDTALFHGSALAAHRVNIALHVAATLAVYAFVRALLRTVPAYGPRLAAITAASAAVLFGVHPIHTEAVDSIFNRSEILATICALGALGALWRWEERRRLLAWSAASVLYMAGLFFRESAVSLPALAILLLALMRPERGLGLRRFAPVLLLLPPFLIYLPLRQAALAAAPLSSLPPLGENAAPAGVAGRAAFTVASLAEYVRMVIWPHPLRVSYEDYAGGGVALAVLLLVGLVGLAVVAGRRAPVVALGIGFFYLALVPSTRLLTDPGVEIAVGGHVLFHPGLAVVPLAERIVYLPSAGLVVPVAFGLAALARRRGAGLAVGLAVALTAVLTPLTWTRNAQWRSSLALAEAEVRGGPGNGDAWRMYVGVLLDQGSNAEIVGICDREGSAHPRSAQLQNSCGSAYSTVGRLEDATLAYRRAIDAGLVTAGHANLGRTYARMGRAVEAEAEFRLAADAEKDPAMHHYRVGQLLERFHPDRLDEAAAEYRQALALREGYAAAREALRRIEGR